MYMQVDHISDNGIDIMAITETWLKPDSDSDLVQQAPPGYLFHHVSRIWS